MSPGGEGRPNKEFQRVAADKARVATDGVGGTQPGVFVQVARSPRAAAILLAAGEAGLAAEPSLRWADWHGAVHMKQAIVNEIVRLGGDPSDETWVWFATRGPHGPSFTWGQTREQPAGYVAVDHLREIVDEMNAADPYFHASAIAVVNAALDSKSSELVRRAIQIAAVIGGESELQRVQRLESSQHSAVASDARACAFYLRRRR